MTRPIKGYTGITLSRGRLNQHPRYPGGICGACGAGPNESCKHPLAVGEEPEEV